MLGALADLDLTQPRTAWTDLPERERSGLVVINPDRVRRPLNRSQAWHLTGRQLEELRELPGRLENASDSEEAAA